MPHRLAHPSTLLDNLTHRRYCNKSIFVVAKVANDHHFVSLALLSSIQSVQLSMAVEMLIETAVVRSLELPFNGLMAFKTKCRSKG